MSAIFAILILLLLNEYGQNWFFISIFFVLFILCFHSIIAFNSIKQKLDLEEYFLKNYSDIKNYRDKLHVEKSSIDSYKKSQDEKIIEKSAQIDLLKAKIKNLNDKIADREEKISNYGEEISELNRKFSHSINVENENIELKNFLDNKNKEIVALKNELDDRVESIELGKISLMPLNLVIAQLTERLKNNNINYDRGSVEEKAFAQFYRTMHDSIPDPEMTMRLASVPEHLKTVQDVQLVTEQYSNLITQAENDPDLSDEEREAKIETYTTARYRATHGQE